MTSSLHVSLPDEMRAYVDLRTNGKQAYATPSEYVRALIRSDMEKETERLYVFKELMISAQDIENGNLLSAEALRAELDDMVAEWEEDEAKAKP